MRRRMLILLVAYVCLGSPGNAQQTGQSAWQREEKSDPLRKIEYTQFTLEGKYLIPPKRSSSIPPMLVVRCNKGRHRYGSGHTNGKYLTGYLAVDAVLDFRGGGVPVQYRLDEGKLQSDHWASSTDGSGAFFDNIVFDTLLYGHMLPHKENTNPPVHKIILGVPEYLGTEIQAEFEMPEPGEAAELCGVIVHRK